VALPFTAPSSNSGIPMPPILAEWLGYIYLKQRRPRSRTRASSSPVARIKDALPLETSPSAQELRFTQQEERQRDKNETIH
jgi:hypothetical protein